MYSTDTLPLVAHTAVAYAAVPVAELKETTVKAICKFLDKIYKRFHVPVERNAAGTYVHPLPVEAFHQTLTGLSSVATIPLGDLAATKANETFEQLPVASDKVEKLVGKILKAGFIIAPPVLGVIGHDENSLAILIGGRHRVTAMLTITQFVPNWQDLTVGVYLDDRYESQAQLILAVEEYNSSRTVTTVEKSQYKLTAKGLTSRGSFHSMMGGFATKALGASDMATVARLASRNYMQDGMFNLYVDTVGTPPSADALGNFGNGALSAFSAKSGAWQNPLVASGVVTVEGLKSAKAALLATYFDQEAAAELPYFSKYLETCLIALGQNWQLFFEQLKSSPDDTSINFARAAASVGRSVGAKVLEQMLPTLLSAADAQAEQNAAAKAESKRKSSAAQLKTFYAAYSQLVALGNTLPEQYLKQALAQMAETASNDLAITAEDFFAAMQNGGKLPEVEQVKTATLPVPPTAPAVPVGQPGVPYML